MTDAEAALRKLLESAVSVELDLLTSTSEGQLCQDSEIFAELGLPIHPQPFLVAGLDLHVTLKDDSTIQVPTLYRPIRQNRSKLLACLSPFYRAIALSILRSSATAW